MNGTPWRPAVVVLAMALTCGAIASQSREQAVVCVDGPRSLSEAVALLGG